MKHRDIQSALSVHDQERGCTMVRQQDAAVEIGFTWISCVKLPERRAVDVHAVVTEEQTDADFIAPLHRR